MDDRSRTQQNISLENLWPEPHQMPPIPEDPSPSADIRTKKQLHFFSGSLRIRSLRRIPQNLLTTLVRQAKRSRFLPPLFIMFTSAFGRRFDGGKKVLAEVSISHNDFNDGIEPNRNRWAHKKHWDAACCSKSLRCQC